EACASRGVTKAASSGESSGLPDTGVSWDVTGSSVSIVLPSMAMPSREQLVRTLQGGDERIHFLFCVVHGERSPCDRRHAQALHQRLRTVMAGTDGDTRPIDDSGDV